MLDHSQHDLAEGRATRHTPLPSAPHPAAHAGAAQGSRAPVSVARLSAAQWQGRGNSVVQVATLQRMQQTYGNRATRQYLQRTAPAVPSRPLAGPMPTVVQRSAPLALTVPAAAPTAIQRCNGTVHEGCECAQHTPDTAVEAPIQRQATTATQTPPASVGTPRKPAQANPPVQRTIAVQRDILGIGKWTKDKALKALRAVLKKFHVSPEAVTNIFHLVQGASLGVLKNIALHPFRFVQTVVQAFKMGFSNFGHHIGRHLGQGVADWLKDTLHINVSDLLKGHGIVNLALQTLQITPADIKKKVYAQVPAPKNECRKNWAWHFFEPFSHPQRLYERAKSLHNLGDHAIKGIENWVVRKVVESGVKKVVTMFVPGGGVAQAAQAAYKVIKFVGHHISQIGAVSENIIQSVGDLAKGTPEPAARKIEASLGHTLSLVMGLLADLTGITSKVKGAVKRIVGPVVKHTDAAIKQLIRVSWKANHNRIAKKCA